MGLFDLFKKNKKEEAKLETSKETKVEETCDCGVTCDTESTKAQETCDCGGVCEAESSKMEETCDCGESCNTESTKAEETCDCGGNCSSNKLIIKVLGNCCKKCDDVECLLTDTIKEHNIDAKVIHVSDVAEIASYGVMSTPAIVINEEVVMYGKVPTKEELLKLLNIN